MWENPPKVKKLATLFVNESIFDINYPELLTSVYQYDINAYKKCLEKLI
jgi:hypothetical protein